MKRKIIRKIKYKIKIILHAPYCIYMCIRFPFLYPRNRFTDKHYNNWKIIEKIKKINQKSKHKKLDISDRIKLLFYNVIEILLSLIHCIPTHTELDAMPKGWRKSFGKQMCKEIKESLKKDKMLYKYRITQIKEKYGTLHWYSSYNTNEVNDIIHKYEYISWHTCIDCGKPAHYITNGWICPYCEDHAPYGTIERKEFYGYTKSKYKIKGSSEIKSYDELYDNE